MENIDIIRLIVEIAKTATSRESRNPVENPCPLNTDNDVGPLRRMVCEGEANSSPMKPAWWLTCHIFSRDLAMELITLGRSFKL